MTVREFLTKWNFKVDHSALDKMEGQLEAIKHRLDFLAAAEVAKGLYELVERFSGMAEQLHLASESAGLTVEQMQKLSFAASQAGVSSEAMQTSMFRLSRALYSARNGGEDSQKAFSRLGISPDQVRTFRTSEDAMMAISDRMKNIKDPVEKSALAMQLMGRGSRDMVGFLSQGSAAIRGQGTEAEKLGAIMSGKQIEALVELEHTFQKLWAVLKAIAGTIAANVAPVFEFLINDFIKFFQANRSILELNVTTWLGEVAYGFGFLWGLVKTGIQLMINLAKVFHLEGHLLDTLATFGSLIAVFLIVRKTIGVVTDAITVFRTAWSFAVDAWKVGTRIWAAGAELMNVSMLPWIFAIGAIIVAGHDLWAMLHGGKSFKDTWIGQGIAWIEKMLNAVGLLKGSLNIDTAIGSKAFDVYQGARHFLGYGKNDIEETPAGQIGQPGAGAVNGMLPGAELGAEAANIGGDVFQVNAPISITTPPSLSAPEAGKFVQNGVKEHLDSVMRQTMRSVTPAVAH